MLSPEVVKIFVAIADRARQAGLFKFEEFSSVQYCITEAEKYVKEAEGDTKGEAMEAKAEEIVNG